MTYEMRLLSHTDAQSLPLFLLPEPSAWAAGLKLSKTQSNVASHWACFKKWSATWSRPHWLASLKEGFSKLLIRSAQDSHFRSAINDGLCPENLLNCYINSVLYYRNNKFTKQITSFHQSKRYVHHIYHLFHRIFRFIEHISLKNY